MADIPETMKAVILTGHGGLDKLEYHTDWPVPQLTPTGVIIRVQACGLNNTDVNTRSGWYSKTVTEATTGGAYNEVSDDDPTWGGAPISFPRIQGVDAVGEVVAVGAEADPSLLGRRVITDGWLRDWDDPASLNVHGYYGSECDGGFAEYTLRDYREVLPVENNMSSAELATFSCSYTTAENLLNRARLSEGNTVLITGASGGVGSALIQLAKRRNATVIALTSKAKAERVKALGADHVLPRSPDNLTAALKSETGLDSVDVVADIVGGPIFPQLVEVLNTGGRYSCSGAIAGPIVDLDLRSLYLKDLTFTGCTVTSLDVFPALVGYINRKEIKPLLAASYPLSELRAAQQAFIDKKHIGNIVVTME